MAGITNDNSKGGLFGGSTGSSAGTVASSAPPDGTGAVALGDNERGGLFAGGDSTGHHDLQRDINEGFEELEELLAAARAARDAAIVARDEAVAAEAAAEDSEVAAQTAETGAFTASTAAQAAQAGAEAAEAAVRAIESQLRSLSVMTTPEDPEPGDSIEVQFQYADGTDFGDPFTVPGGAAGIDGNFTVSEDAPADPVDGDAWLDCDTGVQYIYYGGAWAQPAHPATVTGAAGSLNSVELKKSTVTATVVADRLTYTPTHFGVSSISDNHILIYNGLTLIEGGGKDYDYDGNNIVLTADTADALAADGDLTLIIFRLEIETS